MSMTLEELIAQKKEIERQIRILSNPKFDVDGAHLYKKTNQGGTNPHWILSLEEIDGWTHKSSGKKKEIAVAETQNDIIEYLEAQIATLANLYHEVTGRYVELPKEVEF